jgi:4'-phosphopantetheinyl transferase
LLPHSEGSAKPALGWDSVELWVAFDAEFPEARVAEFVAALSPPETERMHRLIFPAARRQFAVTRALQRHALSSHECAIQPSDWQFRTSAEGRPSLAPPFDRTGLHFNISHTEGVVAMAVCRHARVGIDVEKLGRAPLAVAERFFSSAEVAQLRALPAATQPRRFLELWTLKEAYLKAVGTGLAGGLGRMSFIFESAAEFRFERAEDPDAARWQFQQYAIGAHLLGLAVLPEGGDARLSVTWREFRAR